MSKKLVKIRTICLVAGLISGVQVLQAASLTQPVEDGLADRILFLEKEILVMKEQQQKYEALSKNIATIEKDLESLQAYVQQEDIQENRNRVSIASDDKQIKKTNFFVPAGW